MEVQVAHQVHALEEGVGTNQRVVQPVSYLFDLEWALLGVEQFEHFEHPAHGLDYRVIHGSLLETRLLNPLYKYI